jgi:hypothetical protein
MSLLLRVLALVAFILGMVGVDLDVSMLYLGLALWVASTLVDAPLFTRT